MKPLKPRDKVTQRMTRDGLTLDNQTTGESVNVSSREAEQEYSAAEPGGAAEKVLERAGDIHDRRKAKRAAKDAGDVVTEAGEALHRPSSRLQFTAEERADPQLSKYIHKAEKKADKLDAAKDALPKKRVVTTETVYDEASGRAKTKLRFDKVEKPAPKLKPNPMSRPVQEAGLFVHGKIHEVEGENVGVEGGHKGEELAERQAGKAIRSGIRRHKLKPYRAVAKAERKSIAANAEYIYQKSLRDNPELAQAVIMVSSGLLEKIAYWYCLCVLEECQWIRANSVSSPDFFHGTLELMEDGQPLLLVKGVDESRALDERVERFAAKTTDSLIVIDMADYQLSGIEERFAPMCSVFAAASLLSDRLEAYLEENTGHSLSFRRYYRKMEY